MTWRQWEASPQAPCTSTMFLTAGMISSFRSNGEVLGSASHSLVVRRGMLPVVGFGGSPCFAPGAWQGVEIADVN
ncbi:hypothetical protein D3C71_1620560 [compost metagenome]